MDALQTSTYLFVMPSTVHETWPFANTEGLGWLMGFDLFRGVLLLLFGLLPPRVHFLFLL